MITLGSEVKSMISFLLQTQYEHLKYKCSTVLLHCYRNNISSCRRILEQSHYFGIHPISLANTWSWYGRRNGSKFPVCTYINWIHKHFQFSVHMQTPAPENHPSSSQHMQGNLDVKTQNSHEYSTLQRSCSWTSSQAHFCIHLWMPLQL